MDFYVTADEMQNAEYYWLKLPYLDENNLLRLTGRLLEADLCFGEKHPVILPRRCTFTELLVIREHERIGHCSVSATLTQLRKKYWIPKGRQLVKTIITIRLICKKYSAKPANRLSDQLPRDRITQSPPFQIVGIDFTGEPEPLTPAHFLELGYGDSKYPIHFIELIDATTAKESYKKRNIYRTLLLKQLWRHRKEQYLLQLKTVNHFKTPSVQKNFKLNDVVLVEGNAKPKLLWELGLIKEIFIGRDDNIRSCLAKTFKGLFKKPIQLLYLLEIE
ncbi:uncharacterized protein TNCV_2584131 [Trichonephila clavipes]|nr:uncharacterized protein TNCV_2584131 [Trichonephila clavipes]